MRGTSPVGWSGVSPRVPRLVSGQVFRCVSLSLSLSLAAGQECCHASPRQRMQRRPPGSRLRTVRAHASPDAGEGRGRPPPVFSRSRRRRAECACSGLGPGCAVSAAGAGRASAGEGRGRLRGGEHPEERDASPGGAFRSQGFVERERERERKRERGGRRAVRCRPAGRACGRSRSAAGTVRVPRTRVARSGLWWVVPYAGEQPIDCGHPCTYDRACSWLSIHKAVVGR